jgi:hypothetical protein
LRAVDGAVSAKGVIAGDGARFIRAPIGAVAVSRITRPGSSPAGGRGRAAMIAR